MGKNGETKHQECRDGRRGARSRSLLCLAADEPHITLEAMSRFRTVRTYPPMRGFVKVLGLVA